MNEIKMLKRLIGYFLKQYETINLACKRTAHGLGNKWNWKYIYLVYSGKSRPGPKFKQAIVRLHRKTFNKYPRYRLYIEALSSEQKTHWMKFSMEKRREALDGMNDER